MTVFARAAPTQFGIQPGFGGTPVTCDGFWRNFKRLGRLFDAQSAKESKLDDPTLSGVEIRKHGERIVKRDHFRHLILGNLEYLFERQRPRVSAAFGSPRSARLIHQEMAHGFCRHTEEVAPVLPMFGRVACQADVGFVNQRSSL